MRLSDQPGHSNPAARLRRASSQADLPRDGSPLEREQGLVAKGMGVKSSTVGKRLRVRSSEVSYLLLLVLCGTFYPFGDSRTISSIDFIGRALQDVLFFCGIYSRYCLIFFRALAFFVCHFVSFLELFLLSTIAGHPSRKAYRRALRVLLL